MMANPKPEQQVPVWYNKIVAHQMTLHGKNQGKTFPVYGGR